MVGAPSRPRSATGTGGTGAAGAPGMTAGRGGRTGRSSGTPVSFVRAPRALQPPPVVELDASQRATVHMAASLLLDYPQEGTLAQRLDAVDAALGPAPGGGAAHSHASPGPAGPPEPAGTLEPPGHPGPSVPPGTAGAPGTAAVPGAVAVPEAVAAPLRRFVELARQHGERAMAEHYVETFDRRRRCCLYLTYYAVGDTRHRGAAILAFKQALAAAGYEMAATAHEELPDYLPVVLELSARSRDEVAQVLLSSHREGVEVLRCALADVGSPYAEVVEAVSMTLPPVDEATASRVRALVAAGPPTETVGVTDTLPFPTLPVAYPAAGVPPGTGGQAAGPAHPGGTEEPRPAGPPASGPPLQHPPHPSPPVPPADPSARQEAPTSQEALR